MNFKNLLFTSTLLIMCLTTVYSQQEEKKFGITLGGFVKTDVFYDTRQTVNAREGHFCFFPENVNEDPYGNDINATPNFNILSIQSRITGRITGPDVFGAKTSGLIEGEFFGTANGDVNGFRLRHAFVKLNWEKAELLAGHFWHPLFVASAFPEVLSFNTGVPFQPFSRNPQLRYTYKAGGLNLIVTAYTLREFAAAGPGTASTIQRNAGMPNANFTMTYVPTESKNIFGLGVDYKTLMPEMVTVLGYKTNTTLSSLSATVFGKVVINKITWKVQGLYAQNAFDIFGIGGYAQKAGTLDATTGKVEYTNINTGSAWTELYYTGNKYIAGIFAGYTMNMGSSDEMATKYARGANIAYVYRVAPRFALVQGKTTIGLEIEYTTAAYAAAADIDTYGKFTDSEDVSNVRALVSFIYKF